MSLFKIVLRIRNISILKTIFFNLNYFSIKDALRFPVFIYKGTKLYKTEGEIMIQSKITPGMIKIGPHWVKSRDPKYERTVWNQIGRLIVKGVVGFGSGSKINIGKDATLTIGDNFGISGCSEITCNKSITFGNDCLLSWDVLIMDTDLHKIKVLGKYGVVNKSKPIIIGNHVWIGCRCVLLKGVIIGDNNVIAANSTITKGYVNSNCVLTGNGSTTKVLKENIDWER